MLTVVMALELLVPPCLEYLLYLDLVLGWDLNCIVAGFRILLIGRVGRSSRPEGIHCRKLVHFGPLSSTCIPIT